MNTSIYNFNLNHNLDISYEKMIWKNYILGKLIDIPTKCKLCCNTNVYLTEQDSLSNPFISRFSYFKCRKKHFLKEFTIFDAFPQTMVSKFYIF